MIDPTAKYLFMNALERDSKISVNITNEEVSYTVISTLSKYFVTIDKVKRTVRFQRHVLRSIREDITYPLDIFTEEAYFQYSTVYDLPFTIEEHKVILHRLKAKIYVDL